MSPISIPFEHNVFFYLSDTEFPDVLHQFFTTAVQSANPMVLVMTDAHRCQFETYMRSHYLSPRVMRSAHLLVQIDAHEMLEQIQNEQGLQPDRFNDVVRGLLQKTQSYHKGRQLWVYGEMVELLRQRGQEKRAVELEALWNGLAADMKFGLLCGYKLNLNYSGNDCDSIESICGAHLRLLSLSRCEEQARRLKQLLEQKFSLDSARDIWQRACSQRKSLPEPYRVLLWLRDNHPDLAHTFVEHLQAEKLPA